jgi:membrane-bound lytic murein transglycosylase D
MRKIKINTLRASLLIAMMFFQGFSYAQSALEPNNPIVEMLDSLVSLNVGQKLYNSPVQPAYQPYEVPTYSDDIYAKRMEKIQTPIPLVYNEQVKEYIDLYAVRKRELTARVMGLGTLYFPQFEQILDQQDLPLEFKYLAVVESALNPVAVSRVGATGLWQFMLNTGRLYNLKVNSFIDERKDPVKATLAACQYFKDMYAIYHDWLLVIASYNCGPGNVNRAIARSGGKTTFWEICQYLPKETRAYVPAFIAVTYLMHYPAEHNLYPVTPSISFYQADTVMTDRRVALKQVADAINVPVEMLQYLNPSYKKGIIPECGERCVLRLPSNKVNCYLANINTIMAPPSHPEEKMMAANDNDPNFVYVNKTVKKVHKVKRGEGIASVADRYDCSVQDIKHWNKLRSSKLSAGQKLALYVTVRQKVPVKTETLSAAKTKTDTVKNTTAAIANNDSVAADTQQTAANTAPVTDKSPEEKFLYHVVQPGDTLWNIASRYDGVTVQQLRKINRLNSNSLKVGTKLKVQVS